MRPGLEALSGFFLLQYFKICFNIHNTILTSPPVIRTGSLQQFPPRELLRECHHILGVWEGEKDNRQDDVSDYHSSSNLLFFSQSPLKHFNPFPVLSALLWVKNRFCFPWSDSVRQWPRSQETPTQFPRKMPGCYLVSFGALYFIK